MYVQVLVCPMKSCIHHPSIMLYCLVYDGTKHLALHMIYLCFSKVSGNFYIYLSFFFFSFFDSLHIWNTLIALGYALWQGKDLICMGKCSKVIF